MKFEQLYLFFLLNVTKFNFFFKIFTSSLEMLTFSTFFSWKISNYADSYWFFYSNKKVMYELRYIKN